MKLTVRTQATGETSFEGHVTRLSAEVSRLDRTAAVEGVLESEPPELRSAMYGEVTLTLGELKDAVVVPGEAIIERERRGRAPEIGVFLVDGDRARLRELRVVGEAGGDTAVVGFAPGTRVITLGQHNLRDDARVRVTEAEP